MKQSTGVLHVREDGVEPVRSRSGALAVLGALALLVTGCSSSEAPEVGQVATRFEDTSADAEARCDLLVPAALEQLEQEAGATCAQTIDDLPLEGGQVGAVEVWGGNAQVRLGADTVFLTQTPSGWRVTAAACTPQPAGPYECEVEGS